ncbi:hypothetical protein [Streptomyces sp. NPDC093225]|uniref:hypothetical protein n=1 Tax=Streptomyces sp. NPDC093225 TaxID=3366034 RepID=UPI0038106D70
MPVLHWRALSADRRASFGTVPPTPAELLDAERAVRHVRTTLARAATAAEPVPPTPLGADRAGPPNRRLRGAGVAPGAGEAVAEAPARE